MRTHRAVLIAMVMTIAFTLPSPGETPHMRGLVAIRDEANAVPLSHAVDRLRTYSPIPLDLINALENKVSSEPYVFTILVGVTGQDPELQKAWDGAVPTAEDAWALKTLSTSPLVIAVTGNRPRGVLYATYRLADLLKMGRDISTITEVHSPLVPMRQAAICATAYGGAGRRHSEYMETLNELPRYGINGVMVVPGQWRVALGPGRVNPPVVIEKNGDVQIDEKNQLEWLTFLGVIKSYDLDLTLTAEPFIPPAYDPKQVEDFYKSGAIPPQYLKDLGTFYTKFLETLFNALPYIDTICITPGVEGAQYGGASARSPRMFLQGQDIKTCTAVMQVYLNTATRVAAERGKKVLFWSHQWGSTTDDQIAMWNLAGSYPGVIPMGEDYWPNELWVSGGSRLPIQAYLPAEFRQQLEAKGPLGILSIDDSEYYGGGSMPNAFADPYVFTAKELVKDKVQWVGFRLNQHDRTPFGTLFTPVEILLLQETNGMWTGARTPAQVWDEWIERRYGKEAAPEVSSALARSGAIIHDGFTVNGFNLFEHSWINADRWSSRGALYRIFGAPGTPLYPAGAPVSITSEQQLTSQLHLQATSIEDFRRNQAKAQEEVTEGLASLEKAAPQLSKSDYDYLRGIFINARSALRIFSGLGELAYAANLTQNNYAHVGDPKALFDKNASAVQTLADDPSIQTLNEANSRNHNVRDDLLLILTDYRSTVTK